jgi:hypothetical protein
MVDRDIILCLESTARLEINKMHVLTDLKLDETIADMIFCSRYWGSL